MVKFAFDQIQNGVRRPNLKRLHRD